MMAVRHDSDTCPDRHMSLKKLSRRRCLLAARLQSIWGVTPSAPRALRHFLLHRAAWRSCSVSGSWQMVATWLDVHSGWRLCRQAGRLAGGRETKWQEGSSPGNRGSEVVS